MHGRLSPPVGSTIQAFPATSWVEEFGRAAQAKLDGIEWIYDAPDAETNPIALEGGRQRMRELSKQHGVQTWSCCADYFMAHPLATATGAERDAPERRLHELIAWAADVGVTHIVLPFVDASALRTPEHRDAAVWLLMRAGTVASTAGVELHIESDLGPADFAAFLDRLPFRSISANYDSGNSASLGYAPRDEFGAYGHRVGSVHLKDRKRGGTTVTPGTGDADFASLFAELARVRYRGDFTLQVARGAPGDEVAWIAAQRAYFAPMIASLSRGVR
jgi:hexulose-6-phosphate isomerase